MRILIFTMLFLLVSFVYGQKTKTPDYYINSVKVDFSKTFLNPSSVDSLSISKKTENGAVFIFAKSNFKLVSLDDVLRKNNALNTSSKNVVIRINGQIINDISNLKIDDSYFVYIETERLKDVNYITEKFRELIIINILLESKERKPQIMLKGQKDPLNTLIEEIK